MSALLQVEGLRVEIPTPMGMLHAVRHVTAPEGRS
jgi:hypothetical protein